MYSRYTLVKGEKHRELPVPRVSAVTASTAGNGRGRLHFITLTLDIVKACVPHSHTTQA